jgi:SpoVK/Ycf46/Vps4 family AAA+-type ATPase
MIRQFVPPGKGDALDYRTLAEKTEGYSGSDMKSLCKEALMKPLRRLFKQLQNPDGSYNDPGKARSLGSY